MRKHALSDDSDQVNPNCETWILPRELDRLVERGTGHHQAGAGQHAFLEAANNRLVYLVGDPEIICVDDQPSVLRGGGQGRGLVDSVLRQKRASAASALCKGSARLSFRGC